MSVSLFVSAFTSVSHYQTVLDYGLSSYSFENELTFTFTPN